MDRTGSYWSVEACGWASSRPADALATPWSQHGVAGPSALPPVRDAWDVLGWSPPLPGLPEPRRGAERRVALPT